MSLVDGTLLSIFPYYGDLFTVTHVDYTPRDLMNTKDKKRNIESEIIKNYPEFLEHFQYDHYFYSVKMKYRSESDPRVPLIRHTGNVIDCFTGKIQGIYNIEDYVRSACKF